MRQTFHKIDASVKARLNQRFAEATERPPEAFISPFAPHPNGLFTATLKAGEKKPKHRPPPKAMTRPAVEAADERNGA